MTPEQFHALLGARLQLQHGDSPRPKLVYQARPSERRPYHPQPRFRGRP